MLLVRTQRIPMSQLALARLPLRVYSITTSPAPLSSGEQSAMLGIAVKVRWGEDWLGVQTRASARLPVKWLRCVNICISYAVSIWNWSGNAPVTALFLSLHFQSVTFGQCTHVESQLPGWFRTCYFPRWAPFWVSHMLFSRFVFGGGPL